jgi:hypothetical protein
LRVALAVVRSPEPPPRPRSRAWPRTKFVIGKSVGGDDTWDGCKAGQSLVSVDSQLERTLAIGQRYVEEITAIDADLKAVSATVHEAEEVVVIVEAGEESGADICEGHDDGFVTGNAVVAEQERIEDLVLRARRHDASA